MYETSEIMLIASTAATGHVTAENQQCSQFKGDVLYVEYKPPFKQLKNSILTQLMKFYTGYTFTIVNFVCQTTRLCDMQISGEMLF